MNMKQVIGMLLLAGGMYQSFGQANTSPWPSTGSIGIGTATPATKLEVVVTPTTNTTGGYRLRSNGSLYADFLSTGPTYNSGGVGANEIWLNSQAGNLVLGPATAHDLKFVANGGERMRLLSNGNLGIGNPTPPTKLALSFTLTGAQSDGIQLKSNGSLYAELAATGPSYNSWGLGPNEISLNSQGGHLAIGPATGHDIKFMSTGSEKMRMLASGGLSIGTPYGNGARLSIAGGSLPTASNNGALNFSSSLAAGRLLAGDAQNITGAINTALDASNIEISTGTTSGWVSGMTISGLTSVAATAAGTVRFWTSSAERMRISSAGNVGIGYNNPGSKLVVSVAPTTTQSNGIQLRSNETLFADFGATGPTYNLYGVGGSEIWVNSQGGNLSVGPATNHAIKFVANGAERMRLLANGNFGIGTNAPTTKLSLGTYQTTTAGNVGGIALYETGNTKYGLSVNNQGFLDISGNQSSAGGIRFFNGTDNTAPTERMRITSTGNVGIGTSNPQAKLAVNGDIYAKKVKVTTTGWPDYVFEQNYVLKPLSEVETFILANKHLPEVPSAADIAKNDQDLGEMNKVLLQKVEELTLYLIALEKENKLQKERVDKLEKLVNTK